jgi:hypothetical protein
MSAAVLEIVAYVEQFGQAREHWERAFQNGFDPCELALLATRLRSIDPPTRIDDRGTRSGWSRVSSSARRNAASLRNG